MEKGWQHVDDGKIIIYGAIEDLKNSPFKLDIYDVSLFR
jgi:hypothetical protein